MSILYKSQKSINKGEEKMNENNNGQKKGHQDPQPGHGRDDKGHKPNPPERGRDVKPGNSGAISAWNFRN